MVRKQDYRDTLTENERLTVTLKDGRQITGTLWTHPSGRGRFQVSYKGISKSDGRRDYTDKGHMRAIAKLILAELAQEAE